MVFKNNKRINEIHFPYRELNPGLPGALETLEKFYDISKIVWINAYSGKGHVQLEEREKNTVFFKNYYFKFRLTCSWGCPAISLM